jgi:adenylate kinase family enzyme
MQTFDPLRNQRVCILGNSGSGKTTLGKRMASAIASPLLELDSLVWAKEMPPRTREDAEIQTDLERYLGANERWVIEGCYAKWTAACLAKSPLLVFLDMTEEQCIANCHSRPWQPEKFASKSAQDRTLPYLG